MGRFKHHLTCAHAYWKQILLPEDLVIDATCGNGQDTLYLSQLTQHLVAYDIQMPAVEVTRLKVPGALVRCQSHASFIETQAALIVYNLGYLPGGDKSMTTRCETTVQSVRHALKIATKAISITCYPGHLEGQQEEKALLNLVKQIDSKAWHVCYHKWVNRKKAPSLLWLLRLPS